MGHRIVRNVALIQPNGLALKEVGQGLVSRRWITKRSGSQRNTTDKVLIESTFNTKANPNSGAVAVRDCLLKEALSTDSDVSNKAETTNQSFQCRHALLFVLRA